MAVFLPTDVHHTSFVDDGLMAVNGRLFNQSKRVTTSNLTDEVEAVTKNVAAGELRTRPEWRRVMEVFLLWCFSHRAEADNDAINTLLRHIGLGFNVTESSVVEILGAIEARHKASLTELTPPAAWLEQRPPTQPFPLQPSTLPPPNHTYNQVMNQPFHTIQPTTDASSLMQTPTPASGLNSNPQFQGKYNFQDHKQEYDGYQFQCIFRCLKDGKHCRKAPVREMNRHLREKHNFRSGFKIAGVDWEKKRWRGAGANHKECVGKIVPKESVDVSSDDDEPDLQYDEDGHTNDDNED